MMLRRSLNTLHECLYQFRLDCPYPFASQNRQGTSITCWMSTWTRCSSRGWIRWTSPRRGTGSSLPSPDNPHSDLVFKGVVFNEMKGAMSSITSVLWNELCEQLFPTTTYHYNSGGDPAHIPDLSYEQLVAFYRSHSPPPATPFS